MLQQRTPTIEKEPLKATGNLAAGWYIIVPSTKLERHQRAIGVFALLVFLLSFVRQLFNNKRQAQPVELELFGEEWVVYRDSKGNPVIVEKYCAHLGASLSGKDGGQVVDGCVRCPFHGWQFNSQGQCIIAPEVDFIPKTARQRVLPVIEKYGYIWAWYGTPEPLYSLPEFPEATDTANYLPMRLVIKASVTPRRMMENTLDNVHLRQLHKFPADRIEVITEPPATKDNPEFGATLRAYTSRYAGLTGRIMDLIGLNTEGYYIYNQLSPSTMLVQNTLGDGTDIFGVLTGYSPKTDYTEQHSLLMVKKPGKNIIKNRLWWLLFGLQAWANGSQDVPVWNGLRERETGAFVRADKPVLQFREFYQNWLSQTGADRG